MGLIQDHCLPHPTGLLRYPFFHPCFLHVVSPFKPNVFTFSEILHLSSLAILGKQLNHLTTTQNMGILA